MLSQLSVDRFLAGKPMAITVAGLEELRGHIMARLALGDTDVKALVETLAADRAVMQPGRPRMGEAANTGVIQIRGTISQHATDDLSSMLFGGATIEGISAALDAALKDDSISKIVLDIDSPGGSVAGVTELANKIMASRGQKPIIAVANSLAASAAYWIGAACDQFFVTPSGQVGSVGVIAIHQDISKAAEEAGVKTTLISAGKYKTAGNQFEPLDPETQQRVQGRVNDIYQTFVHDVARGRGVPDATVRDGYGEGDVLTAKQAKTEGMVDGVMTLDQVISRSFSLAPAPTGAKAETIVIPSAQAPDDEAEEPESTEEEAVTQEEPGEAQARYDRMRLKAFQARATADSAA